MLRIIVAGSKENANTAEKISATQHTIVIILVTHHMYAQSTPSGSDIWNCVLLQVTTSDQEKLLFPYGSWSMRTPSRPWAWIAAQQLESSCFVSSWQLRV